MHGQYMKGIVSSTTMSGSDNGKFCGGVGKISSGNKTCTSYAQKVEQQKDGACENGGSGDKKGGILSILIPILLHMKRIFWEVIMILM